jgi:Putative prokaryotic signal transducing protein
MSDNWETAKIVGTEEEAALVAGFLNNNGIEAQVESLHASEFPTDFGHLGEVHVMVHTEQLAEAQQLLAESDAAAEADDEDEDGDSGE